MLTSPLTSPAFSSTASTNSSSSSLFNNPASSGASTSSTTGSGYAGSSSTGNSSTANSKLALTPTDFINMMITQLKNQDPTQPTSNADLLQQMSQIGQLQSQQSLQTNLQSMVLQNQISSASNFIGKRVSGLDTTNHTVNGVVDSVHIENGGVNLNLDNGSTLALSNLTDVDSGSTGATTTPITSPTTSGTSTNTGA